MSHYECDRCGYYGCIDPNCMSDENVELEKIRISNVAIELHKATLNVELAKLKSLRIAKDFLIEKGCYDVKRYGVIFE